MWLRNFKVFHADALDFLIFVFVIVRRVEGVISGLSAQVGCKIKLFIITVCRVYSTFYSLFFCKVPTYKNPNKHLLKV